MQGIYYYKNNIAKYTKWSYNYAQVFQKVLRKGLSYD